MRFLIPILLLIVGTGGGIGAGMFLVDPPASEEAAPSADNAKKAPAEKPEKDLSKEYVKLNNQFVVPVVRGDRVSAMVVLSLSLEVDAGTSEDVFSQEPKLRDAFLQVLFDHANVGGFSGAFTSAGNMNALRNALYETAKPILRDAVSDVLIVDIARQDV
ncbi:flagellar basal body-associated FliL family protein [Thalassococcus sp. S3]|uniref:flagellar basal body-associated FliL family protein n=1 Tax=Thalassococcus sp. S3 TaxID=2017482 RepID=UPI0010245E56|nr:flagellar basal body-associated FliL family protein [Thalassococcus sp. S3]QBF29700.1 flagellar basal body-associated protein FliL [Thalassococcus sp. S3]